MKNKIILPESLKTHALGLEIPVQTFFKYFHKLELQPNGCWVWTGGLNSAGYGNIRLHNQYILAHRLFFAMYREEPGSSFVLHVCDNPPCCNPDHHFLGDYDANMKDMTAKGRHWSKLTAAVVSQIYQLSDTGMEPEEVSLVLNISKSSVNKYLIMRIKSEKEEE